MKLTGMMIVVLAGLVLSLTTGCVSVQKQPEVNDGWYFENSEGQELSEEITAMESSVEYGSRDDAEKVLKLAFLASSAKNKSPDYEKALEMTRRYMSVVPENERQAFAGYIQYLLEIIVKKQKEMNKNKRSLKKERVRSGSLVKKNQILENKMLELKKLEIRLEKQRLGAE